MTLAELKAEIQKYQYFERTSVIDVVLAATLATQLQIGDPIWLVVIGASSGGKSQILRPVAMTNPKFIHRIDDITENTFLSGMAVTKAQKAKGQLGGNSLLHRIGPRGIIVISDLTVLFSKNSESKTTILSQFRMLYDGEMVKFSGMTDEPIAWKGKLGVISGSTPSIYSHFEEVADMGERFIYYRMEEYDRKKAAQLAINRGVSAHDVDNILKDKYTEYLRGVIEWFDGDRGLADKLRLDEDTQEWIVRVALFAERLRASVHTDWKGENIDRVPVMAYPTRVVLQLRALGLGLLAMKLHEGNGLGEEEKHVLGRCAYSLANEEKRACLRILGSIGHNERLRTTTIADKIGLNTAVIGRVLQGMAATGVLERSGDESGLSWRIKEREDWEIVRYLEDIHDEDVVEQRVANVEDDGDSSLGADIAWEHFGK